jgi:16S rRNA G966 N2-methylase RsmD
MGIESVSYGFKTVFTEKFKSIYKILRSNLIECKIKFNEFKYSQIKKISDISSIDTNILVYSDIIKLLDYMNFKTDIIFIDPPYKSNLVDKIIYHKNFKNIIKQDTIIVYETSDSKFNPEKKFNIFNKKKFGKSFVYFFKIKI